MTCYCIKTNKVVTISNERRGDHEANARHSKCYLKMQNITGGERGGEVELGTSFVVYQHYDLLD